MADAAWPLNAPAPALVVALSSPTATTAEEVARLVQTAESAGAPTSVAAPEAGAEQLAAWALDALARRMSSEERRAVILVTDEPDIAGRAAGSGCVAVLLAGDSTNAPDDAAILRVPDLSRIGRLFGPHATSLWVLARATEAEIRDAHERCAARFAAARTQAGRLLIFGSGTIGRQLRRSLQRSGIEASGFVDNNAARLGTSSDGLPVIGAGTIDVERDSVVVAAGMAAAAIEAQLDARGVRNRFNLSEVFYTIGVAPEADFAAHLGTDWLAYVRLFIELGDERSRETLAAVIRHRLTLDTAHLARVCVRHEPQWFDRDVVPEADNHVFVDGGAFDGDSIAAFSERFGGRFRRAIGFELDPALAAKAAARHAGDPRVSIVAKGLSDGQGWIRFTPTGGTDGSLVDASQDDVSVGSGPEPAGDLAAVVSLDSEVAESVTFLKLDVEGAELAGLRGAAGHLVQSRPLLALAAYHRATDLRDIPRYIASLRAGDRMFLRHYTDVAFETVLYVLPRAL